MKKSIFTLAIVFVTLSCLRAQPSVIWGAESTDSIEQAIGQFDGGLNGWQAVSISDANGAGGAALWTYTATGHSQGAYYDSTSSVASGLTSPTAANGAALFDSDFLDNGGVAGASGAGAAPAPHTGALISPSIDLTGNPDVLLQFHSYFRRFTTTEVFVGVSIDSGATWFDFQALDPLPSANAWSSTTKQYVDISPALTGAATLNNVQIRFLFDGDYYFWMVDDVSLIQKPSYNLAFADYAPWPSWAYGRTQASSNYYTPLAQVDKRLFGFGTRIWNYGMMDETAARLVIQVDYEDEQGNIVLSDFRDSTWFEVRANSDTIVTLPGSYEPDVPGTYTVYYTLVSGGNETLLYDNVDTQSFVISNLSDNWMSKVPKAADGGPAANRSVLSFVPPGETLTEFEYGSMFYIKAASTATGTRRLDSMYYRPVNYDTMPNASMANELVLLRLYKWIDADGDGRLPTDHLSALGTELFIVGMARDTLPSGIQSGDLRRLRLFDTTAIGGSGPILLEDSTTYLATVLTRNSNGVSIGIRAHDDFNYALSTSMSSEAGLPLWPSPTRLALVDANGNPVNPNALAGEWYSIGYGADLVPSIALRLSEGPTAISSTRQELSDLQLFPNPTDGLVQLSYPGEAKELSYTVMDIQGRVLHREIRKNVRDDLFIYDASGLPAGVYLINVCSEAGMRTLSFRLE